MTGDNDCTQKATNGIAYFSLVYLHTGISDRSMSSTVHHSRLAPIAGFRGRMTFLLI